MSAAVVRRVVLAVCVVGIAGMIVTNIADNSGGSMTFGLITAAAVLCSIVATAVSRPAAGAALAAADDAEHLGAQVEQRIAALVAGGADEEEVRRLVADAVRLGRVTS
ncbi:MAG TPA: hypothetical protein VM345_03085 [Acidimicrobiales bacterium]|jgi:hypothetical protein|nr:hypothetical protein [Acidimicrobiales bacterium]